MMTRPAWRYPIYPKKMWWKIEYDRDSFPWGGSVLDVVSWAVFRSVNGVLSIFGKGV